MNGQRSLWLLVGLSALTASAQYVIQGTLAVGGAPSDFSATFLRVDAALWGARALVEAAVVVYLFCTTPRTRVQSVALAVLEVALIGVITLTVGPALRAMGLGTALRDTLTSAQFTAWNFALAAYTSLMVGAAGYAYRVRMHGVQEADTELARMGARVVELQDALAQGAAQMRDTCTAHSAEVHDLRAQLDAALAQVAQTHDDAHDSATHARAVYADFAQVQAQRNGDGPMGVDEVVQRFGVQRRTAQAWVRKYDACAPARDVVK